MDELDAAKSPNRTFTLEHLQMVKLITIELCSEVVDVEKQTVFIDPFLTSKIVHECEQTQINIVQIVSDK